MTAPPLSELELPALYTSPGRARDILAVLLAEQVDEHVQDRVLLLVSELVTNAVLHARTCSVLRLWVGHGVVRVEVHDQLVLTPRLSRYTTDPSTGCGLRLVATLATCWGVQGGRTGKCVWFEVSTRAAA